MYNKEIINFIKSIYKNQSPILLHKPIFIGNEKIYINDCIDSTYISSVGEYVNKFENMTSKYVGSKYSIAAVNGTAALHMALILSGVKKNEEVITQSLTFVATANAIKHANADPVFIDVDKSTLGISPEKLDCWIKSNTFFKKNKLINKNTKKRIAAIVPMHTFGNPCYIDDLLSIGEKYNIPIIEDSAESLGSKYKGMHTGTFGLMGIFSYNGNKTISTGGGGMIVTNNEEIARKAKHITTTAKIPHQWEYNHDKIGYNYRLTNISAAIGVAQMENIDKIIKNKRDTSILYRDFFNKIGVDFFIPNENCLTNNWLNIIFLNNLEERNSFLKYSNDNNVFCRPVWVPMNELEMYKNCQTDDLENTKFISDRLISLPSGYRI